jgi:hypothetical protein
VRLFVWFFNFKLDKQFVLHFGSLQTCSIEETTHCGWLTVSGRDIFLGFEGVDRRNCEWLGDRSLVDLLVGPREVRTLNP